MNFKTIADGIANVAGTITVGNETATATARLPNTIGTLALLVYPPTGNLALVMGPHLEAKITYELKLLRDPLNMPDRSDMLLYWVTALYGRMWTNYDLDIPGVIEATTTDIECRVNGEKYWGANGTYSDFDLVNVTIVVHVWELQTLVP